jgi:hypothetical protein
MSFHGTTIVFSVFEFQRMLKIRKVFAMATSPKVEPRLLYYVNNGVCRAHFLQVYRLFRV